MMEKIPVIIDTDPGSDDIFAIFLANSSSRLDIRGLSVVAGNMKAQCTKTHWQNKMMWILQRRHWKKR